MWVTYDPEMTKHKWLSVRSWGRGWNSMWSSYTNAGIYPKDSTSYPKDTWTFIFKCYCFHSSKEMESGWMPINRWMATENMYTQCFPLLLYEPPCQYCLRAVVEKAWWPTKKLCLYIAEKNCCKNKRRDGEADLLPCSVVLFYPSTVPQYLRIKRREGGREIFKL